MKKTKFALILLLSITLVISFASPIFGNEIQADENDITTEEEFLSVLQQIEIENDEIYEQEMKEIQKTVQVKKEKLGDNSKTLTIKESEDIKKLEHTMWMKMQEKISENMKKNGFEVVEQNQDINNQIEPLSVSSNMSLVDDLYYNEKYGYFVFTGYWNWANGTYDSLSGAEDIAAFRALNAPSEIVSSSIRAYDQYGTNHNNYVSKRDEDKNGVIFNVVDKYSGALSFYPTDNGRITVSVKEAGAYNKYFLDYEHNYKRYTWSGSFTLAGAKLTGSSLTVNYSGAPSSWQRTSNGKSNSGY